MRSFNIELSCELKRARKEGPEEIIEPELTRDNWMVLADIRPGRYYDEHFDDIRDDQK